MTYERHLTPAEMAEQRTFYAKFPGWKKRWDLIAAYAQQEGGLVLEFLQLHWGPAFGKPWRYSLDRCAERLQVPVSTLMEIGQRTLEVVEPQVRADPQWQELQRIGPEGRRAILRGDRPS